MNTVCRWVAVWLLFLAACGDDGGGGPADAAPPPPDARPPLACGALALQAQPIEPGAETTGAIAGSSATTPQSATCAGAVGPEAVYYVQTDHMVDLLWEITPDFDGVAYIRSQCDGSVGEVACTDLESDLGFERAEYLAAPPDTYFLFVDGFETGDVGAFTATLRLREIVGEGAACDPEIVLNRCSAGFGCNRDTNTCTREQRCDDLEDDDRDGLIDCEDPTDCQTTAQCTPGDGEVGAACTGASDCAADNDDPACLTETGSGYPAGYCTHFCNLANDDCGDGATCMNVGLSNGKGLCFDNCLSDADCTRADYACRSLRGTVQLCLPACTDDSQCAATGHCDQDSGQCVEDGETCDDGADNDADSRIDCEDRNCGADATCSTTHATACAAATAATSSTAGDTSSGTQAFSGSCTGWGTAFEDVYTYTPGSAGEQGFLLLGLSSTTDQGVYVRTTCGDASTEIACVDLLPGGSAEKASVPVEGGATVSIFVDGYVSPAEAGPYTLTVDYVVATEVEPNDTFGTANTFADPYVAQIGAALDHDWIAVAVPGPASSLAVQVDGLNGECALRAIDSEIEVFDTDGATRLAFNDDISQTNFCSRATASSLAAGTYYVRVSASQQYAPFLRFPYELGVTVTP